MEVDPPFEPGDRVATTFSGALSTGSFAVWASVRAQSGVTVTCVAPVEIAGTPLSITRDSDDGRRVDRADDRVRLSTEGDAGNEPEALLVLEKTDDPAPVALPDEAVYELPGFVFLRDEDVRRVEIEYASRPDAYRRRGDLDQFRLDISPDVSRPRRVAPGGTPYRYDDVTFTVSVRPVE